MQPPITASTSSILPSATVSREAEVLALLNQVGRMEVFKCGMERIYVLLGLMEFDDGAFRTLVRSWAAQKNVGAWIVSRVTVSTRTWPSGALIYLLSSASVCYCRVGSPSFPRLWRFRSLIACTTTHQFHRSFTHRSG